MAETIIVIYEKGILRPLHPLQFPEHTELHIAITAPERLTTPLSEQRRSVQSVLRAAGAIAETSHREKATHALTAQERAVLADRLALSSTKPLSEIIIEEREGR